MRGQKGDFPDVRKQINDLDNVASLELAKCSQTHEGFWEWSPGKNYTLSEDGQGLDDSELINSLSASNIVKTYRFKIEITR